MHEMKTLESLSIFIGMGRCNANCGHCAGKIHRKYAPTEDGVVDEILISQTLKDCYDDGARYLSISSSGEPTLSPKSVTRLLEIVNDYAEAGIKYNPINLYSNGIRIGKDERFCNEYLPTWKDNGLTTIYVTVHDINEKKNAEIYRINNYPSLELIMNRIHDNGLLMRANIVLSKNTIGSLDKFVSTTKYLLDLGTDYISAWPIRGIDDNINYNLAPPILEMDRMEEWIKNNYIQNVRLLREQYHELYDTNKKLTLFPDGTLSNKWCS